LPRDLVDCADAVCRGADIDQYLLRVLPIAAGADGG
jgi:hypothetical protein